MKKILNISKIAIAVFIIAVVLKGNAPCHYAVPQGPSVFLPHESDCNLFYECVDGVKFLRNCPEGLHFNVELGFCDWPWSAGCEESGDGGDDPQGFKEVPFNRPYILVYDEGMLSLYRWEKGHTCKPDGDLISCTPKCEFCETHDRGYTWTGWDDCANI